MSVIEIDGKKWNTADIGPYLYKVLREKGKVSKSGKISPDTYTHRLTSPAGNIKEFVSQSPSLRDAIRKVVNNEDIKTRTFSKIDPKKSSSDAFKEGVARSAKKISNGKDIDPTAEGSLRRMVSKDLPNEAPHVDGKGVSKPDERDRAFNKPFSKKMSEKHFNETSAEPISNSTVKNSVWNKLKNSKAGNWLKNTKLGSYFTDSPLIPMNVALTHKPHMGGLTIKGWRVPAANPVAYAANAYGMGSGGGYMPVGEHTVDQLRIQHGKDELSNQGTNVPINPQGTQYLDPKLGVVDTQVLTDEDGIRYYKNAQTGQFDPLDSGAPFRYSSIPVEQTPFPKFRTFNIGDDADYPTDSDANKPLPPMSADTAQPVQPVVKPKRMVKPPVVNNTPAANVTPVQPPVTNTTPPVAAPTLSSVASQAVRHNGGFDNYRRQSVLSALRAAGGISPAEAVQRGIIPWEALNYV